MFLVIVDFFLEKIEKKKKIEIEKETNIIIKLEMLSKMFSIKLWVSKITKFKKTNNIVSKMFFINFWIAKVTNILKRIKKKCV